MQLLRCMECGKAGHVKCTKEKESNKIHVDVQVKDDLEEFVQKFVSKKD
jgi:C4-type Zn-finger protein